MNNVSNKQKRNELKLYFFFKMICDFRINSFGLKYIKYNNKNLVKKFTNTYFVSICKSEW